MNASELMIGDHVFFLGHVHQIRAIEHKPEDNLSTIMFYGKNKVITTTKEVEPIPLTAEILEKNGFVVEPEYCFGEPLQYCEIADGLWIYISGENYVEGKLGYVHELQRALRCCGLFDKANDIVV